MIIIYLEISINSKGKKKSKKLILRLKHDAEHSVLSLLPPPQQKKKKNFFNAYSPGKIIFLHSRLTIERSAVIWEFCSSYITRVLEKAEKNRIAIDLISTINFSKQKHVIQVLIAFNEADHLH